MKEQNRIIHRTGLEIAVIGMAVRFPGAKTTDEYWENLKNGVESIAFFSDDELKQAGVDGQLLENPDYRKAKGVIGDIEYFDASFFDYIPREAEILDPQTRVFHECAWEVLEHAGYDPQTYPGLIALYVGASPNPYWEAANSVAGITKPSEQFAINQLYDRDFVASRVSYKLGLKGSTFALFTACSTSMVTIHLACSALLSGECDMALAGGTSIMLPEKTGYLYEEGMILSQDAHNRTFDEKASGSVLGDGVGVVALKSLEDAIEQRDTIHAVIKGSALNNDGNRKLGYTAPSVDGQSDVILAALEMAEVEPAGITYLEAHGTATPLGDVVEIEALNQAYGSMDKKSCAIGSVKSNLGHLNIASGVSGFIKTVLALKHKQIPPSLHFEIPNARIDFENSPFYVNTSLQEWKNNQYPLRAGVSSFGMGGTNVHLILEEAPAEIRDTEGTKELVSLPAGKSSREYQLILLSAKTQSALELMTENLAKYMKNNPDVNLADAVYTLQVGRRAFPYRKMMVCSNGKEALDKLSPGTNREQSSFASRKLYSFFNGEKKKGVIFMFAGLGDQYVNIGRELYEKEPLFQEQMDRCFEITNTLVDYDLKEILYPHSDCRGGSPYPPKDCVGSPGQGDHRGSPLQSDHINQPEIAQLTVFIIEYALARLLMEWGMVPNAMIGYSFGEYAAACIAGVISLADTLKLVAVRGRLMSRTPGGAMLSVPLTIDRLKPLVEVNDKLSIAIDNGASCIVAGPVREVEAFDKQMKERRLICIRLESEHAVHSTMMEPILPEFQEAVNKIVANPPRIPYISNVSGDWITGEEALDRLYWGWHLRHTVRFSEGLSRLLEKEDAVFLEIGPGRALGTHLKQQESGKESKYLTVNFLRHPEESISDVRYLLNKIGQLWLWGVKIDWKVFYRGEKRCRIPLPTYPFEGQPFWKELPTGLAAPSSGVCRGAAPSAPCKQPDISNWFYYPSWKPSWLPETNQTREQEEEYVMMLMDEFGLGLELAASLEAEGCHVIGIEKGAAFETNGEEGNSHRFTYTVDPTQPDHFKMLLKDVRQRFKVPARIFYLWGITNNRGGIPAIETIDSSLERYFYSLIYLAGAIGNLHTFDDIHLLVLTDNMQDVTGEEVLCPEKAPAEAACKVISQEYSNITCRSIDIILPRPGSRQRKKLVSRLLGELKAESYDLVVVYRGNYRWVKYYEPMSVPGSITEKSRLKTGGVYLITGGLGGVGHVLAKHLAVGLKAKLVLTGLTVLPARDEWEQRLSTHPEEESVSRKIRKVQELEALGAEVMVFSADVANQEQMRGVISRVEEHFGSIDGVIHAAGTVGIESLCVIDEIDKQRCQRNFQPKLYGMLALEKVLQGKELDFCLAMSSMSSVLAGLGLAAYSAANLFMDAFTRMINRESRTAWISVNWDGWRTPDTPAAVKSEGFSAAAWEDFAMTPEEGIECFRRVLSLQDPGHVVHSTGDLYARINQWLNLESLRQKQSSPAKKDRSSSYTRPGLSNSYVAPGNKLERIIADVWQKFLGIDQVGIDDNFFDLNATSLDIVRVNSILKDVLKRDIAVLTMFNYPTIGTMARFLSQQETGEAAPDDEMDRGEVIAESQERMKIMRNRNVRPIIE